MARMSQGGSLLGFIIAAIIMAGLLIGGAYTLRQLTAQQPVVAGNDTAKEDVQKQATPEENKKATSEQTTSSIEKNDVTQETTSTTVTELPQTGPGGIIGSVIILAILSGIAASYARSRRPELSL